ncbi:hypothetical protein GCM10010988_01220 [Cnuibacter physcomitrellae]|uniref:Uncharacterized protein n=2 Tax=Cnuibacter physcomitrellae TaxID=1619308 RepID=A0A1X9LIR3_9MICO|nr:hypothetical protein B5808_07560 [Cnuibacter physcomitrellae]GGI34897.1 hypothetical protein GCM10010988_01220 [Cnuibacter physcomitrellae]
MTPSGAASTGAAASLRPGELTGTLVAMTSALLLPSALQRTGRELPLGIERELGYRPTGSLVLAVERGLGSLVRVDLPRSTGDAGEELGRALAGLLARERFAERVVPVVFAPALDDAEDAWEHGATADRVAVHLGRAGFVVLPGLVVAGEEWSPLDRVRWRPLREGDGVLAEGDVSGPVVPRPAPLARQRAAWAGLAAAPPTADHALGRLLRSLDPPSPSASGETGAPAVSDVELVAVAHALDDPVLRDHVVAGVLGARPDGWIFGARPTPGPGVTARLGAAVPLLRRAASLAPESLLPSVLTVIALVELALGRVASARVLLGAALEQDRDYALAGLVSRLAAAGQVPHPDRWPALTAPATPGSARRGGSARSRRTPAARSSREERVG